MVESVDWLLERETLWISAQRHQSTGEIRVRRVVQRKGVPHRLGHVVTIDQSVQRLAFQKRPRQARIKDSCCHNQRQPYNYRVATAGAEHGSSRKQGPPVQARVGQHVIHGDPESCRGQKRSAPVLLFRSCRPVRGEPLGLRSRPVRRLRRNPLEAQWRVWKAAHCRERQPIAHCLSAPRRGLSRSCSDLARRLG